MFTRNSQVCIKNTVTRILSKEKVLKTTGGKIKFHKFSQVSHFLISNLFGVF